MAKYKLTKVSYYEDNEQAGDDNYNQQYVQGIADAEVAYWNRCEAELQVNDGKTYKVVADGGPTDHPERRSKWPWVLASEMLPTKSGHYVVCWEGQWHPAWFASETDAIYNEPFFEIRKMGQIVYLKVYKNRFDQLWWRTIELPEED